MNSRDKKLFNQLIKIFFLGQNKSREIVELLALISKKEKQSTAKIIQSKEMRALVELKQKGQAGFKELKAYLFARANPTIARCERLFAERVRRFGLPCGARIEHSPGFERDELALKIVFNSKKELARILEDCGRAVKKGRVEDLFSVLKDAV